MPEPFKYYTENDSLNVNNLDYTDCKQNGFFFSFKQKKSLLPPPTHPPMAVLTSCYKIVSVFLVLIGGCVLQLYNVVVDNELTSNKLIKKGQLERRHTFIPINKIQGRAMDQQTIRAAQQLVSFLAVIVHTVRFTFV